ncbi:MAG TPA: hemolysin [Acinetobacter johnsonii]|nr:hemolysin [Acinetobacter johnsonii]
MCRCLCMILMALLPYQAHAIPELPKTMQGSSICNQNFANKLVGKYNLTDKQILRISQASIVRRIGPNSIITKEYALARVTVTIDPKTKVILKAQCG